MAYQYLYLHNYQIERVPAKIILHNLATQKLLISGLLLIHEKSVHDVLAINKASYYLQFYKG